MAATTTQGSDRRQKSQAIHTNLDDAASLINAAHAKVLSDVIEARDWNIHRDFDGFSALRDWLVSKFDFHVRTAADLAAIARLSKKFKILTEAATSGDARIDSIAYAVRQFDKTTAMRLHARTPYRQAVPSPFDPAVFCSTPEALAAQYCVHAPFSDLKEHLAEVEASIAEHAEILDGLSEESLKRLEIWQQDNGMWALDALLPSTTGLMLDKLLKTAVAPPRQDETDTDGVLPPAPMRNAEALHHMIGVYGSDPHAATRHGETCQLNLSVDVETLQGKDTGRTPTLEGDPISLEKARLLACEALVVPMVFNYATGEAIELGRALRLPNTALRRKLVAEQPRGCAWTGCGRPAAQAEAHHITPWWAGGETNAENLILLCRFHHGRVHTPGWSITKTGPGQALIVHHEGHEGDIADGHCGCDDYRSAEDLDADFENDISNIFPTGLYPEEWGPNLKEYLDQAAQAADLAQIEAEIKAARAKLREKFAAPAPKDDREPEHSSPPALMGPSRATATGRDAHTAASSKPDRFRALSRVRASKPSLKRRSQDLLRPRTGRHQRRPAPSTAHRPPRPRQCATGPKPPSPTRLPPKSRPKPPSPLCRCRPQSTSAIYDQVAANAPASISGFPEASPLGRYLAGLSAVPNQTAPPSRFDHPVPVPSRRRAHRP